MLWLLRGLIAAVLLQPAQGFGQDDRDIEYAEIQPLATQSLLLDVVRGPGGRLIAVGERGHIIISDDGESWRQAEVVPTRSTLTTVTTAGDRLWAAGHDTVIITSGDGGKTWSRQYFDPERQQPIMDILFADDRHGTVIGAYGLMMTTDDGGQSWEDAYADEENEFHLNSLVPYPDGRLMIAGEAGYSYRSFDDGETWERLELPYHGSMWGALAVPDGCVLFFGLRGHVQGSCDFGNTWWILNSGTQASLSGAAVDGGTTIIVGNSGTVLVRENRGDFEVYSHSSGVDLSAAEPLGEGRFIVVGEDGVHYFPEAAGPDSGQGAQQGSGS